ncbi:hypothetical protein GCM10022238_02660 [Gordonia hankookensis]
MHEQPEPGQHPSPAVLLSAKSGVIGTVRPAALVSVDEDVEMATGPTPGIAQTKVDP